MLVKAKSDEDGRFTGVVIDDGYEAVFVHRDELESVISQLITTLNSNGRSTT